MRDLLKAILKTGSGSVAAVIFGVITVKLIAWRLGPAALGSFSLTRQWIVAGSALFVTGGQTALVQGMANRRGRDREAFTSTAFALLGFGCLLVAALVGLSIAVFGRSLCPGLDPATGLLVAASIAISGPMTIVFGTLNATRRIGWLALAQAINAASLALMVWMLLGSFRSDQPVWFAAVLAASQIPGILLGGVVLAKSREVKLCWQFSLEAGAHFARIALATAAAAGLQAWTVLFIRSSITARLGLGASGIFDAAWSLSMVYVMLILGSFSTYYLPALAGAGSETRRLINDVLRTTLLLVVPLVALVMTLRSLVLVVLYSSQFFSAGTMMRWMFLGDFFKVVGFVLAMPMVARPDLRAFLLGEIGWNALMLGGSQLVLAVRKDTEGIGVVFAITYLAYLIYALRYCRKTLDWHWPRDLQPGLLVGCGILAAVSVITWSGQEVRLPALAITVVGAIVQARVLLRKNSVIATQAIAAEAEA